MIPAERIAQRLHITHPLVEFRDLLGEELPDAMAFLRVLIAIKKIANDGQGKTERLRLLDKMQAFEHCRAIEAIASAAPWRWREERFPFIKADGVTTQA
jgi:hypothetical protein